MELAQKLAACRARATADAVARNSELLSVSVAEVRTAGASEACATKQCAEKKCAAKVRATAACEAKACETVAAADDKPAACATKVCAKTTAANTVATASCETKACSKTCETAVATAPACPTTLAAASCDTAVCKTATCATAACESTPCSQTAACKSSCSKPAAVATCATAVATDDTATDDTATDDTATPGMKKCFDLNSREATMVTSAKRLDHLQKAAEHLAAAGCEKEAACVTAWATEVKQDMVSHLREMSEHLKEAATELEAELKAEATDMTTSAPAECEPVAAACPAKACELSTCDQTTAREQKSCKPQQPAQPSVTIVEVNLTDLRKMGLELPGCASTDGSQCPASSVEFVEPARLAAKLDELKRNNLVRTIPVTQCPSACGSQCEIKYPESASHVAVQTGQTDCGRIKVDITPCASETPIENPNLARYKRQYEVDAHFEMPCGQAAVIGGEINKRVRVEKRMGLTSVRTIQETLHYQTLYIVTPGVSPSSSPVKQVSHTEPAETSGAAVCPKACPSACEAAKACSVTSASTACEKKSCEKKSCDAQVAAADCPASVCAKTEACAKSDACAKAACEKTAACATASACPTTACPTTACPTAAACDQATKCNKSACAKLTCDDVSVCPATAFLTEAVATDAKSDACKSAAYKGTACAEASADAPCSRTASSSATCATAACEDAPCIVSDSAANSNAGCVGVIACDTGVEAAADQSAESPVATGSYLEMHLSHLTKAAEHLTEVGLTEEAASVQVLAGKLRQELIAAKQAQIASLQEEIAALAADCNANRGCAESSKTTAAPKQIKVQLKLVDVDVAGMKRLGFSFDAFEATACLDKSDGCVQMGVSRPNGLPGFFEALERERLANVLTVPTLQAASGQQTSVACRSLETYVALTADSMGQDRIRIHARPQIGKDSDPVDCHLEIKSGDTAVLSGAMPNSDGQRQVVILVTPTLMTEDTAVKPVAHQQLVVMPAAGKTEFRAHCRTQLHGPIGHCEPLPKVIFTQPDGGQN